MEPNQSSTKPDRQNFFIRHEKLLRFLSNFLRRLPLSRRVSLLERFRGTRGSKGTALRFALLKATARACGDSGSASPGPSRSTPRSSRTLK
mgnify:CR=1 FL=1